MLESFSVLNFFQLGLFW